MMRAGIYRPVHVKTLRSQSWHVADHCKLLQSKAIAVENDLRGTLRNFGLKVGIVGKLKFEARIKELVENLPDLAILVEPLLAVRRVLREQTAVLHRRLLAIVRDDAVCRRLMTIPGCWSGGGADLPCHRRCARALSQLQGSRSGVGADTLQASIGRDQSNRRDIKMRGRDDASDALRSGPEHAGTLSQMVLAQGLGDADRQAPRHEEGNRRAGASLGRHHAPHLG